MSAGGAGFSGPHERGGSTYWTVGDTGGLADAAGVRVLFVGVGPDPRRDLPRADILAAVTTPANPPVQAETTSDESGAAPSATAPWVTALSVPALSVPAPSVPAPSVTAPSVPAPSVTAPSVTAPSAGLAAAHQVHSARVLVASASGRCGEGDALVTAVAGLAVSVITADCVPVLIFAGGAVAAVHAGWRGIVAGVVAATVARLRAAGAPHTAAWTAWIGPTIGVGCYEVDEEVAAQVARASSADVVLRGLGPKPHLDLVAAVTHQLGACGLTDVRSLRRCTSCDRERLWSYRRQGRAAGRNLAAIWRL